MVQIERYHKSPRHGVRVDAIILHYVSAINVDAKNPYDIGLIEKILLDYSGSYHYLIDRAGVIYKMVPEDMKAWHAGDSQLFGRTNCNTFSIGVSFLATAASGFTPDQIEAGVCLCRDIYNRYPLITPNRIVGHEHVSPFRKKDPGKYFPYRSFIEAVCG